MNLITNWCDGVNDANVTQEPKVPTKIRYEQLSGNTFSPSEWGWNLGKDDTSVSITLEWFKLFLNYEAMSNEDKNSPRVKLSLEKLERIFGRGNAISGAGQATKDFISFLWPAALQAMGNLKGASYFGGMPIKLVVTTPSTWTSPAVNRTRTAVESAIDKCGQSFLGPVMSINIVPEPEAAARACLNPTEISHRQVGQPTYWHWDMLLTLSNSLETCSS